MKQATRVAPAARALLVALCFSLASCATIGARDEIVAGVTIPVPGGMRKAPEEKMELNFPGFSGGRAAFRGSVPADEVVEFYKKEMSARGWRSNASLVTHGGMLAYSKDGKNVLIMISGAGGDTALNLVVGSAGF
ncbi:MAG: hypothetical protein A3F90_15115 [Deltaproteobacteria bacterium RIFCSPLOWO2_12_FULL_60_19]|nr:MAG: hypothetical protein A3F90_15115 [Deltaproteobacteria bacterium RIFCSPLOWO2_12_FULL_60_19]